MSFSELAGHERGFARIYETRMRPVLSELAAQRHQLEARRRRRMRIFGSVALVAAGIVIAAIFGAFRQASGLWAPALIILSWITLLASFPGLLVVWGRPSIAGDDAARRRLLPIVAEHLGLTYDHDASGPPDPVPFLRRGLITRANFGRFEDAVKARIGDVGATMLRADFANRGNAAAANWKGLLLQADLPARAPVAIRIGGDEAWRLGDGFVSLPDHLPHAIPAAADDPRAAAAWLAPALMERLDALRARFDPDDKGRLRVVIDGTTLRLSIRDPATAPLPMPDPTAGPEAIEQALHMLIDDAALPRDVAATLRAAQTE